MQIYLVSWKKEIVGCKEYLNPGAKHIAPIAGMQHVEQVGFRRSRIIDYRTSYFIFNMRDAKHPSSSHLFGLC